MNLQSAFILQHIQITQHKKPIVNSLDILNWYLKSNVNKSIKNYFIDSNYSLKGVCFTRNKVFFPFPSITAVILPCGTATCKTQIP